MNETLDILECDGNKSATLVSWMMISKDRSVVPHDARKLGTFADELDNTSPFRSILDIYTDTSFNFKNEEALKKCYLDRSLDLKTMRPRHLMLQNKVLFDSNELINFIRSDDKKFALGIMHAPYYEQNVDQAGITLEQLQRPAKNSSDIWLPCILYHMVNHDVNNPKWEVIDVIDLPKITDVVGQKAKHWFQYGLTRLVLDKFSSKISIIEDAVGDLCNKLPSKYGARAIDFKNEFNGKLPVVCPHVDKIIRRSIHKRAFDEVVEKLEVLGASVVTPESLGDLSWESVAGNEEIIHQIKTIIRMCTDGKVRKMIGAIAKICTGSNTPVVPTNLLFYGPPGTGKTLTAKVMAKMAGIPFIVIKKDFLTGEKVGETSQNVESLFTCIRLIGTLTGRKEDGPQCIIFIDEIDGLMAIGKRDDQFSCVTPMLEQLTLNPENKNYIFISATNNKGALDPAFMSRMHKMVFFGLPDAAARKTILKKFYKNLTDEEMDQLVVLTDNLSGRSMENASIIAIQSRAGAIGKMSKEERAKLTNHAPTLGGYIKAIKMTMSKNEGGNTLYKG